jgi:hypothetical protein
VIQAGLGCTIDDVTERGRAGDDDARRLQSIHAGNTDARDGHNQIERWRLEQAGEVLAHSAT